MKAIFAAPVRGDDPTPQWARRPISQVMSRPVVSAGADVSLDRAMATMLHAGVRHLAVVDTVGRCLGVLAARSVAAAWSADPAGLATVTVGAVLDHDSATVDADARVRDAARVMHACHSDAVAVVDGSGTPVGVFTSSDLIRLLAG
ncbi:CBS domain-containing protein [Catellatospora sp. NPDC049133]|jgi:predicted transcriptional regulator|uniref:CBS domain-containing protein n=1 Tax=Catellatospora sp. NPDC049133 TaxID=3155499 RepID=UPI0033ECE16C